MDNYNANFYYQNNVQNYDLINLSLDGDSHFDNPPKMSNKAPLIIINHFSLTFHDV